VVYVLNANHQQEKEVLEASCLLGFASSTSSTPSTVNDDAPLADTGVESCLRNDRRGRDSMDVAVSGTGEILAEGDCEAGGAKLE
jgi:hypothetical protein